MIKIIFCDMDGTLLDENSQLPVEFKDVMRELKKRGVIFAPTSGRQYFALRYQLAEYKDDFIFLAENGTYGAYRGKELFSSIIEEGEYRRVLGELMKLPKAYPVVCGKECSYILRKWEPYVGELDKFYTKADFVDSYDEVKGDFIKLAAADCQEARAEENIYLPMSKIKTSLHLTLSSDVWVDFTNPEANKGWAVKKVQKLFGFKPEECAAFGDYMNDYEMMQSVYYSYAMENAHPELKKVARFQAASNKEHGVMRQIEKFIEQGLI